MVFFMSQIELKLYVFFSYCLILLIEDDDVQSHIIMLYAVIGALICIMLIAGISIISYYKVKLGKLSISEETENSSVSVKRLPISMIVAGNTPIPTQEEFEHLLKYDNKLEQRLTVSQGQLLLLCHGLVYFVKSFVGSFHYVSYTWK